MGATDDPIPVELRYERLEAIGSGGLGEVYRALTLETGEHVAIKVLRMVDDPAVGWHRIRRELTALVSLSGHPHVVQLIELVDVDGSPGIVMEYAPFGSVARFVAEPGATPPAGRGATLAEIVLVARHAAAALVVAHEQGIIHRDVKPHNLLIGSDGRVMLCDFGVSALDRTRDYRTRTHARSLGYSSPEDFADDGEITAATDVYSLGATLLHLAHGAPPTLEERLSPWSPPPAPDEPHAALDAVIAACLHPEAHERPSAVDVLARLERLDWTLDDRIVAFDVTTRSPVEPIAPESSAEPADLDTRQRSLESTLVGERRPPPRRPGPDPRRGRSPVVVGAIATVVLVATGAGWWLLRDRPASSGTAPAPVVSGGPTTGGPTGGDGPASIAIVGRPAGLPEVRTEVVWPFGRLGECLVQRPAVGQLVAVDCDQPHDLQRIAIAELDDGRFGPDATFDGRAIDRAITELCARALGAFVGVTAEASVYGVAHTRPSEQGWAAGDRGFQCLLGIEGRRTIGDAVGSRR